MKLAAYASMTVAACLGACLGCGGPKTADAPPPEARVVGAALEDAIYEFQCAYVSARPRFSVPEEQKHDYRMCEAVAMDMDHYAQLMLTRHLKEFMPVGAAFNRDLQFIARHAHDLAVSCAEHRPGEIRRCWERMVVAVERAVPPKVSDGAVARPVVYGERSKVPEHDPFTDSMAPGKGDAKTEGGKPGKTEEPKPAEEKKPGS